VSCHLCYANAMGSTIRRDIRTVPNIITLSRILLILSARSSTSMFPRLGNRAVDRGGGYRLS